MPEPEVLPLVIRDLSFRYNSRSTPAITNINLELRPGEFDPNESLCRDVAAKFLDVLLPEC